MTQSDTQAPLSAEELKPCPFCGAPAERIDIEEGENEGGSCISCTGCQASSNVEFGFKENFVSNWNRRALPSSEPSGDEARKDAWDDFFGEHLTDGNDGYRTSEVIARCRAAFDAVADRPLDAATAAALAVLQPSEPSGAAEGERAALADLIHRFYMAEIGRLMQQAEHWAANDKPSAVHHRLQKADAYFQVSNLFDPQQRALGRSDPFTRMEDDLARPPIKPSGTYPYSRELHRYNDVHFVSAELNRLTTPAAPSSAPVAGEAELREVGRELRRLAVIAPACGGLSPEGKASAQAVARAYNSAAQMVETALAAHSPSATASGGGEEADSLVRQLRDYSFSAPKRALVEKAADRIEELERLLIQEGEAHEEAIRHGDEWMAEADRLAAQNPQPEGKPVEVRS